MLHKAVQSIRINQFHQDGIIIVTTIQMLMCTVVLNACQALSLSADTFAILYSVKYCLLLLLVTHTAIHPPVPRDSVHHRIVEYTQVLIQSAVSTLSRQDNPHCRCTIRLSTMGLYCGDDS